MNNGIVLSSNEELETLMSSLTQENRDALLMFLNFRIEKSVLKKRGNKLPLTTYKFIIRKVIKLQNEGYDVPAVIERSIVNGWLGLFEKDSDKLVNKIHSKEVSCVTNSNTLKQNIFDSLVIRGKFTSAEKQKIVDILNFFNCDKPIPLVCIKTLEIRVMTIQFVNMANFSVCLRECLFFAIEEICKVKNWDTFTIRNKVLSALPSELRIFLDV